MQKAGRPESPGPSNPDPKGGLAVDISETLAPNSDQLDAIDLVSGPRTFTITKVTAHNAEQPVNVHLAEFPRVWRPGKSMRRVLAACWGTDASTWVGRRVTLYCDESVRFGSEVVGGTRISHLSHIDKPKSVPLLVSRGKSATFTVQPLPEQTADEKVASLRAEWQGANPERRKAIEAEVATLTGKSAPAEQPEPELDDPTADPTWGGEQA
jgi:hypothetical protein